MHFGDRCVNGVYSMLIVMNCVLICLVNSIGKNVNNRVNKFVEFRDNKNLHVFQGNERRVGHMAKFEWHTVCHVLSSSSVNLSSRWGPR